MDSADLAPKRLRATNRASRARMRLSTLLREGVTCFSAWHPTLHFFINRLHGFSEPD